MDGMDASSMESDMGDMNDGTIDVTWFPQLYWIFIGPVIGAFSLAYALQYLIFRSRISHASRNRRDPARPHNVVSKSLATTTAILREISNASLPNLRFLSNTLPTPTVGSTLLISANVILLLVMLFYQLNPNDYNNFQNIAYRAGFLSLGQLPLIFLLAGKSNVIGFFTGHSYERLNWIHRWTSRCLLLTVTLHMGFWFGLWAPYDYIGYQIQNDTVFTQTGLGAWCILLWITVSSFLPLRSWCYEFFYIQHILSFIAFIVMVLLHTPSSDHGWIWAGVAIFVLDRTIRGLHMAYCNLAVLHSSQRKDGTANGLWACKAELTPLSHSVTRIVIRNPPIRWTPGQHVYLSSLGITPMQAHPFSVSTIPEDGRIEFLVKVHSGATRRFFDFADKHVGLPTTEDARTRATSVVISGPYGMIKPLRQFDSVVFLAGSVGITFTLPLMREIVAHWKNPTGHTSPTFSNGMLGLLKSPNGAVTRHVRFVWIVKAQEHLAWYSEALLQAMEDVEALRASGKNVKLSISCYVTCDDRFTAEGNSATMRSTTSPNNTRLLSSLPEAMGSESSIDEKESDDEGSTKAVTQTIAVKEVDPRSDSGNRDQQGQGCKPDGTCCCKKTVKDESDSMLPAPAMTCNCSHKAIDRPAPKGLMKLHKNISLVSGRPHPHTVVNKVLEQARGETAVVACGPRSLNDDTRRAVVSLSDERAVHKGSGAQGVWFWGEGYGL